MPRLSSSQRDAASMDRPRPCKASGNLAARMLCRTWRASCSRRSTPSHSMEPMTPVKMYAAASNDTAPPLPELMTVLAFAM